MPPSIATAIAEGNLDPISMEAFNHFPSSRCYPDPVVIQTSDQLPSPKAAAVSTQESSFTVFSSHRNREIDIAGKFSDSR
jgi:exonuclease-1